MTILFKLAAAIQKAQPQLTRRQALAKAIALYNALESPHGRGTGR